jgi:hypothetical protein
LNVLTLGLQIADALEAVTEGHSPPGHQTGQYSSLSGRGETADFDSQKQLR